MWLEKAIKAELSQFWFQAGRAMLVIFDANGVSIRDIKEQENLFTGEESPVFMEAWEKVVVEALESLGSRVEFYLPQDFQKSCLSALKLKDQSFEALVVALRQKSRLGKYIQRGAH